MIVFKGNAQVGIGTTIPHNSAAALDNNRK